MAFSDGLSRDKNVGNYVLGGQKIDEFSFLLTSFSASSDAATFVSTYGAQNALLRNPQYEAAFENWVKGNYHTVWERVTGQQLPKQPQPTQKKVEKPAAEKGDSHTVKSESRNTTNEKLLKPLPNRFHDFNTMTYGVSLYLMSPDQLKEISDSNIPNKTVKGMEVILQSGGIDDISSQGNYGATRSKYFNDDYYIDNIQFKSLISGTSVNAPFNTFELNFTITEPMGLTFLENLRSAISDYNEKLGVKDINFISQIYLMVIRFYGYDKNGKQILGIDDTSSDSNANTEKWIPFMFTGISFRLETNKVVYDCKAVCPQSHIGTDAIHGIIPFNVSLQGQTLKDVLGDSSYTPDSGTRDSTNTKESQKVKLVTSNLIDALNNHQKILAKNKKYDIADEYAIEFEKGSPLETATVAGKGTPLIDRTGMPGGVNQAELMKKATGNTNFVKGTKTYQINAGMTIMTFLDIAVRTSSYIYDQYDIDVERNAENKDKPKPRLKNPKAGLMWYKIRPRIEIKGFDKKRQAYAFKITYVISTYPVKSIQTANFSNTVCPMPIKSYDYWFTGKNTDVLNFTQDYNFLYYTSFGSKTESDPNSETNNIRLMRAYQNQSKETEQGDQGHAAQLAANAASFLYSPADQAQVEVDIVGDPDWIAQSELFYPARADSANNYTMPDGSINYDATEVFFTINFNTVVDYNRYSGVADVTQKNVGKTDKTSGVSEYSLLYRANTITSQLEGGSFKQRLEGSIIFVPENCMTSITNKVTHKDETKRATEEKKQKDNEAARIANKKASTDTKSNRPQIFNGYIDPNEIVGGNSNGQEAQN